MIITRTHVCDRGDPAVDDPTTERVKSSIVVQVLDNTADKDGPQMMRTPESRHFRTNDLVAEYLAGGSHPPVGLWFARRTGGLYGNPVEVMTVDVPLPAFLMRERVFTVDNSIDDGLLTMSVFVLSVERVV